MKDVVSRLDRIEGIENIESPLVEEQRANTVKVLAEALASGELVEPFDVEVSPDKTVAVASIAVKGSGLDAASEKSIETLREDVVPATIRPQPAFGRRAAYGVLTWVFQDGHGEQVLNFESVGGITSWIPPFLFVILFGLSMDYHVFVLSRIRKAVDRRMSTDDAVAHGIKSAAGVLTSAALVMVAVLGMFTIQMDQQKHEPEVAPAAA